MRQVAPWGKPVTNPGAFGLGADDETFGARLRMPGSTPDQVRLGRLGDTADTTGTSDTADLVTEEDIDGAQTTGASGSPWLDVLKNAAMVGVGGALVGYLATGGRGWRGAYIGATANVALFYFGTAFAGRKVLPASTTWVLAGLGVASAAGAGYFFNNLGQTLAQGIGSAHAASQMQAPARGGQGQTARKGPACTPCAAKAMVAQAKNFRRTP